MCLICRKEYNRQTYIVCCHLVTEIPSLPNLTKLWCNNTQITALPSLPNLTVLDCSNTQITALPSLPNLTELDCSKTKITALPFLPKLIYLYCNNTQITAIPSLPNLTYLNCNNTQITALPSLPKLTDLVCGNTQITAIPSNVTYLQCSNCPWLEQSYDNKQEFQERIEKLIKIQKLWRNKRYLQYTKNLPLHQDIIKYVLKGYLV